MGFKKSMNVQEPLDEHEKRKNFAHTSTYI